MMVDVSKMSFYRLVEQYFELVHVEQIVSERVRCPRADHDYANLESCLKCLEFDGFLKIEEIRHRRWYSNRKYIKCGLGAKRVYTEKAFDVYKCKACGQIFPKGSFGSSYSYRTSYDMRGHIEAGCNVIKRKEEEREKNIKQNLSIIERCTWSKERNNAISTKRKKFAVYRLYRYLDLSPQEITLRLLDLKIWMKEKVVRKIIGEVFAEECLRSQQCVFKPFLEQALRKKVKSNCYKAFK